MQSKTKGIDMAWTTPKTWSSEPLTSLDLNTYVRDNQNHLKDRLDNSAQRIVSSTTKFTSNSQDFVDVDAAKLALTLETHGGDVLVGFTGAVQNSATFGSTYFNLAVDGVDYIADDGIARSSPTSTGSAQESVTFVILVSDLAAGSHTFKIRWKASSGNTSSMNVVDLHPQFWAKEI